MSGRTYTHQEIEDHNSSKASRHLLVVIDNQVYNIGNFLHLFPKCTGKGGIEGIVASGVNIEDLFFRVHVENRAQAMASLQRCRVGKLAADQASLVSQDGAGSQAAGDAAGNPIVVGDTSPTCNNAGDRQAERRCGVSQPDAGRAGSGDQASGPNQDADADMDHDLDHDLPDPDHDQAQRRLQARTRRLRKTYDPLRPDPDDAEEYPPDAVAMGYLPDHETRRYREKRMRLARVIQFHDSSAIDEDDVDEEFARAIDFNFKGDIVYKKNILGGDAKGCTGSFRAVRPPPAAAQFRSRRDFAGPPQTPPPPPPPPPPCPPQSEGSQVSPFTIPPPRTTQPRQPPTLLAGQAPSNLSTDPFTDPFNTEVIFTNPFITANPNQPGTQTRPSEQVQPPKQPQQPQPAKQPSFASVPPYQPAGKTQPPKSQLQQCLPTTAATKQPIVQERPPQPSPAETRAQNRSIMQDFANEALRQREARQKRKLDDFLSPKIQRIASSTGQGEATRLQGVAATTSAGEGRQAPLPTQPTQPKTAPATPATPVNPAAGSASGTPAPSVGSQRLGASQQKTLSAILARRNCNSPVSPTPV